MQAYRNRYVQSHLDNLTGAGDPQQNPMALTASQATGFNPWAFDAVLARGFMPRASGDPQVVLTRGQAFVGHF